MIIFSKYLNPSCNCPFIHTLQVQCLVMFGSFTSKKWVSITSCTRCMWCYGRDFSHETSHWFSTVPFVSIVHGTCTVKNHFGPLVYAFGRPHVEYIKSVSASTKTAQHKSLWCQLRWLAGLNNLQHLGVKIFPCRHITFIEIWSVTYIFRFKIPRAHDIICWTC